MWENNVGFCNNNGYNIYAIIDTHTSQIACLPNRSFGDQTITPNRTDKERNISIKNRIVLYFINLCRGEIWVL